MITPGQAYQSSGKYNLTKVIIYTLIGSALATGLGLLYGLITEVDPFIYLNMLVLFGTILLLGAITVLIRQGSHSRNVGVNFLVCVILCFVAWYAQWAYYYNLQYEHGIFASLGQPGRVLGYAANYANNHSITVGRFGHGGLPFSGGVLQLMYVVEFFAFMLPLYFALKVKDYYCEQCSTFYSEVQGYIDYNADFNTALNQASGGNYRFIEGTEIKRSMETLQSDPAKKNMVYKIDYHFCPKCGLNSIVEIVSGTLQYDDKGNRELANETTIVADTYVDEQTAKIITNKFIAPKATDLLAETVEKQPG